MTFTPDNATNKEVEWKSSDEAVATVSTTGVVTGKAAGKASITVTSKSTGKIAICYFTVNEVAVTDILLDATLTIELVNDNAAEKQLIATIVPKNATNKEVEWSSSD